MDQDFSYQRMVIAGVVFGILSYLVGWFIWGGVFFDESTTHSHLWRRDDSQVMLIGMPLASVLKGIMFSIVYVKFYHGIPGEGVGKGIAFGFMIWLFAGFGLSVFWYTLAPISFTLLVAAFADSALSMILGGIVVASILGDPNFVEDESESNDS